MNPAVNKNKSLIFFKRDFNGVSLRRFHDKIEINLTLFQNFAAVSCSNEFLDQNRIISLTWSEYFGSEIIVSIKDFTGKTCQPVPPQAITIVFFFIIHKWTLLNTVSSIVYLCRKFKRNFKNFYINRLIFYFYPL